MHFLKILKQVEKIIKGENTLEGQKVISKKGR